MIKLFFFLMALCATQISFGMEDEQALELSLAAYCGDLGRVKQLLSAGVNPSHGDCLPCDRLPLCFAAVAGHSEMCQALLNAGAHVDQRDPYGTTPLKLAVHQGKIDVSKLLLAAGADVNAVSKNGVTPLMNMCISTAGDDASYLAGCELLLQYGADHERRDNSGRQAVVCASDNLSYDSRFAERIIKVTALLTDPEKIRAVIMRADNPNLKKLRRNNSNVCNAIMNRELGRK